MVDGSHLLAIIGASWTTETELTPGAYDKTFSGTSYTNRLNQIIKNLCTLKSEIANQRVPLLLTFGQYSVMYILSRAKDMLQYPDALDHLRAAITSKEVPDGFSSVEHVIHESVILFCIYGC